MNSVSKYFIKYELNNLHNGNLNEIMFNEKKRIYLKYVEILSFIEPILKEHLGLILSLENIPLEIKEILKDELDFINVIISKFNLDIYLNAQKEYSYQKAFQDLPENVSDLQEKLELTNFIIDIYKKYNYTDFASKLSSDSYKAFYASHILRTELINKTLHTRYTVAYNSFDRVEKLQEAFELEKALF